jgi:MFS family permease
MMLGTIVGSQIGGRLVLRVGFRVLTMAGLMVMVGGIGGLAMLGVGSTQLDTVLPMALIGIGMGLSFISTTLAAQNSVETTRMGLATSLVNFCRQLGGALGVAGAAAVMLTSLTSRLSDLFPNQNIDSGALLSPQAATGFPARYEDLVRGAFADSLHLVFVVVAIVAAFGVLTTLLMPGGKPRYEGFDQPGSTTDEAILPDGETFVIVEPFGEDAAPSVTGTNPNGSGNGNGSDADGRAAADPARPSPLA